MAELPQVSDYLRYEVTESRLFFSTGEVVELAKADIQSFSIESDYSNSHIPVAELNIKTDYETYIKLIKDREKVTIQLKVDYYIYDPIKDEKGKIRTWFNRKFDIYMEDDYPDLIKNTLEVTQEASKAPDQEPKTDAAVNRTIDVKMALFVTKDMDTLYASGGGVYTSANMETVVSHSLATAGASKVLMSPIENKSSFSQITVPPFTLLGRLQYLNSVYGFYKTGMIFFLGLEHTYLIDRSPKTTAMEKNEIINIIFLVRPEKDENRRDDGSRLEPEQKTTYINVDSDKLLFNSPSVMNNMLKGSTLRVVDTHGQYNSTYNISNRRRGNSYVKFYHNKFGNPYASPELASELSRDDRVVVIPLNDVNIHWLRPNKEFTLRFIDDVSDSLYGSKLMMYYTNFTFNNHGDHFRVYAVTAFKKV